MKIVRHLCVALVLTTSALAQSSMKLALPCVYSSQEISPSGQHVAVRCTDKSVHLFELPTGHEMNSLPAADAFDALAFSPDGDYFAAGNNKGEVRVVNIRAPSLAKRWHVADTSFDILKFVSWNQLVISPHSRPGEVWEISPKPARTAALETDFDGLTSAAVSPDGKWLVTTGADTVVRFYDTSTWKLTGEYRDLKLEPFSSAFTADGKYAVVGGADGQLSLFDPASGKLVKSLPAQTDPILEIDGIDASHVAVLYFDVDGRKPPHMLVWDLPSVSSRPFAMDEKVTGGAIVKGHIWTASGAANSLELRQAE